MKKTIITVSLLSAVLLYSCKPDLSDEQVRFVSPEIGASAYAGEPVLLQVDPGTASFDSIVFYADGARISAATDSSAVQLDTRDLRMGNRLLTARIYRNGIIDSATSNVVLKPSAEPENIGYEVIRTFPHDTSSYTQGLEFHDGIFYESDGENGGSSIRKVALSGKVLEQVNQDPEIFAEGLTVIGDKVIQLTWLNKFGLVWEKSRFRVIGQFPYQSSPEGWGLTHDSSRLYKSDGSNMIYFLNRDTYMEEGFLEVYSHGGPVNQLNELEYIDGRIFANVYQTDMIVVIDPRTGAVTGQIDLSGLYPADTRNAGADVLNGIAYDPGSGALYVTGKKWDKLFQIRLKK
ncbi:MAG TPA: glutaminyl-peptide cyclotransferase [Sphingobacteriaceae bacterium]